MNALKSLYVTLYMVATMSIAVLAVQMLLATQDYLTWGGVLLVYAPFVLVPPRRVLGERHGLQ